MPIDHAFILPSFGYFREAELVWRYWLSSNIRFGGEALAYVAALDAEADVAVARQARRTLTLILALTPTLALTLTPALTQALPPALPLALALALALALP